MLAGTTILTGVSSESAAAATIQPQTHRDIVGNYAETGSCKSEPNIGTYHVGWDITTEDTKTGVFSGVVEGPSEAATITGTVKVTSSPWWRVGMGIRRHPVAR
jgi:hypothetical protein